VRQEFIRSPSPLGNKAGMRERDAKQHGGIVSLRQCSSKEYCVRLRTYVRYIHSKACARREKGQTRLTRRDRKAQKRPPKRMGGVRRGD
jgi:hypothetical protein